jgi:hypothetical protein
MNTDLIIQNQNQNHLPTSPMPSANFVVQIFQDQNRIDDMGEYFRVAIDYKYSTALEKTFALKQAMATFEQFFATDVPAIVSNLDRAMQQQATAEDISIAVAVLMHSFPNVKDNFDSTIYSQQLIRFLSEWQIADGVLSLAFRNLVLTHKWLPSIADIRIAIEEAMKTLRHNRDKIYGNLDEANPGLVGWYGTLRYHLKDATKDANVC